MSKIIEQLSRKLYVAHIDDERAEGNSILVTLATNWYWADEPDCGVRGFDTVAELRSGLTQDSVVYVDPAQTPLTALIASEAKQSWLTRTYGTEVCPHCGIDLCNGVGEHLQEVNGTRIKHEQFIYACLGCGEEFGPAIPARRASVSTNKTRPAMVESMKLDRRILHVETGEVYANACRVWKAGLVSSAQGDRLSAVLYGAAKAGNRAEQVVINGHTFKLAEGV